MWSSPSSVVYATPHFIMGQFSPPLLQDVASVSLLQCGAFVLLTALSVTSPSGSPFVSPAIQLIDSGDSTTQSDRLHLSSCPISIKTTRRLLNFSARAMSIERLVVLGEWLTSLTQPFLTTLVPRQIYHNRQLLL